MTLDELKEALAQGKEIEFELDDHPYSLQPAYDGVGNYCIYDQDGKRGELLFVGDMDSTLAYRFGGQTTLRDHFYAFSILYIH